MHFSHAVVGDELEQLLFGFGRVPGGAVDRRLDGSGGQRVDADLVHRQFLRHRLHQHRNAALGGCVVRVSRPGNDVVDRGHADDLAGGSRDFGNHAATQKLFDRLACAEKLTGQIHVDHELPIAQAHLMQWRVFLQPCVVDEDVDAAPGIDHLAEHRLDVGFLADICANSDCVAASLLDVLHHFLGAFFTSDVVNDHASTGVCKTSSHGLSDTGVRAGNQCPLTLQRAPRNCLSFVLGERVHVPAPRLDSGLPGLSHARKSGGGSGGRWTACRDHETRSRAAAAPSIDGPSDPPGSDPNRTARR